MHVLYRSDGTGETRETKEETANRYLNARAQVEIPIV